MSLNPFKISNFIAASAVPLDHEMSKLRSQLLSKRQSILKSKSRDPKFETYSSLDVSKIEGEGDIYSIDEIYDRDVMSQQQRRFGSPEFVVRGNSMMFDLPTDHLEMVKAGVKLTGCEKPLHGPRYDSDPYHECEVEESEEDEASSFENDWKEMLIPVISPPKNANDNTILNLDLKNSQMHDSEQHSITSSSKSDQYDETPAPSENPMINLKELEAHATSKLSKNLSPSNITAKSRLSVLVPTDKERLIQIQENIYDHEPMTTKRNFIILNITFRS